MSVERLEGEVAVSGNRCPRGEVYGREESLAPRRTVTAVVRTDSMDYPCVPVRTDAPLARERIFELLCELYALRVTLPLAAGSTLVGDWKATGVNVIVTRTLPPHEVPAPGEPGPEAEGHQEVTLPQHPL
jgi:CxxC motif-containing protein